MSHCLSVLLSHCPAVCCQFPWQFLQKESIKYSVCLTVQLSHCPSVSHSENFPHSSPHLFSSLCPSFSFSIYFLPFFSTSSSPPPLLLSLISELAYARCSLAKTNFWRPNCGLLFELLDEMFWWLLWCLAARSSRGQEARTVSVSNLNLD